MCQPRRIHMETRKDTNSSRRQADAHTHIHTQTHIRTFTLLSRFPGPAPHGEALGKEKQCESCGGGEGDRKSECQQGPENGWGVRRGSSGWAPMCWAFPVAPKLTGWQGGGHCHILSASGICQAWHGAWQGGGGPLLPGIPSLSRRGRAGATQAPNGFQAPTLKAGVGSRLNSSSPPSSLALPLLGVREEDEEQWGQGGSAQLSCRPRVP